MTVGSGESSSGCSGDATNAVAGPFVGLEVLEKKGSLIGHDGDQDIHTPYDNCVLIMPSRRLVRGQTAVRLGRFVD